MGEVCHLYIRLSNEYFEGYITLKPKGPTDISNILLVYILWMSSQIRWINCFQSLLMFEYGLCRAILTGTSPTNFQNSAKSYKIYNLI